MKEKQRGAEGWTERCSSCGVGGGQNKHNSISHVGDGGWGRVGWGGGCTQPAGGGLHTVALFKGGLDAADKVERNGSFPSNPPLTQDPLVAVCLGWTESPDLVHVLLEIKV